uniref:Uncharacterized protein n=1 Tax=Panagrolaimus sp. JU765 TaxID=591449 RepID=A0AC34Q3P1_9BILA
MNQVDQATTSHPPSLSSDNSNSEIPSHCCCNLIPIKFASNLVSTIFAFFIITNFLVKIAGYSDLEWNWELLFLCSDSVAVACLFYGTHVESAAFFQPFIVLSLITISFLILLFVYTGAAVYDPHSYPGEYLELLLHEHSAIYAEKYQMESKNVVSIFALIDKSIQLVVEPLYEAVDQAYTESPLQRVFARA